MASTNLMAPQPLESFTLFPTLPPELRIKIWQFSIPGLRVVKISSNQVKRRTKYNENHVLAASPSGGNPTILQINQESRSIGLELYRSLGSFILSGQQVYVNFDTDIFVFREPYDLRLFTCSNSGADHPDSGQDGVEVKKIQRVLVSGNSKIFVKNHRKDLCRVLPLITHVHGLGRLTMDTIVNIDQRWEISLLSPSEASGNKMAAHCKINRDEMSVVKSLIGRQWMLKYYLR